MTNVTEGSLIDLAPNNPRIAERIHEVGSQQAAKIIESCKPGIDKVNTHIEKLLSIPDNVVLWRDKVGSRNISPEQLTEIETEIKDLMAKMKENSIYINCLRNELSTYEESQESIAIEQANMNITKDFLNKNLFDTTIIENCRKILNDK